MLSCHDTSGAVSVSDLQGSNPATVLAMPALILHSSLWPSQLLARVTTCLFEGLFSSKFDCTYSNCIGQGALIADFLPGCVLHRLCHLSAEGEKGLPGIGSPT